MLDQPLPDSALDERTLNTEIVRLNKVIKALMDRAERSPNLDSSHFSVFENMVILERQVRSRTAQLEAAVRENERINRTLRETERKYREIFDDAIVGVFQSEPGGRLLSANPFMARMLGYDSPDDAIASIDDMRQQFYADSSRAEELCLLLDRSGGVQDFECTVFRKDGSKIWITATIRAIIRNGVTVRHEGMIEDVTERRLLRERLLQAQKLESVGQLAAGIAHEINTPTQFIGDNTRFLSDAFGHLKNLLDHYEQLLAVAKGSDDKSFSKSVQQVTAAMESSDVAYLVEEIPKAIEQTLDGVTRVSTLVAAMKEFSHPATKEKTPLDLNRCIATTITIARNEWKYVAELEADYDQSLPMVSCLPGELGQVILNLIVNAAHAISDVVGGDGSKRGTIKVQTKGCAEWAEVRIGDSGGGIPKQIQARVFDLFFTTKGVGKGSGQGLSIAHSVIVDRHQGTIHFETEEGKGTTFVIRLPYNGKSSPDSAASG